MARIPRGPVIVKVDDRPPPRKPSARSSAKAKRSAARLTAVQILYQAASNGQTPLEALKEFSVYRIGQIVDDIEIVPADRETLDAIIAGVAEYQEQIDSIMTANLKGAAPERIELLMRCILRAGIVELFLHDEIAPGIIIGDYLSVTEAFYDSGSEIKLINGVLDAAGRYIRANRSPALTIINDTP
jgi:N utilization substance protein B